MTQGKPAPLEMIEWDLAERFHWTLDEVGALSLGRLYELSQIDAGREKASNSLIKKGK